jgi:hypothetical protein
VMSRYVKTRRASEKLRGLRRHRPDYEGARPARCDRSPAQIPRHLVSSIIARPHRYPARGDCGWIFPTCAKRALPAHYGDNLLWGSFNEPRPPANDRSPSGQAACAM